MQPLWLISHPLLGSLHSALHITVPLQVTAGSQLPRQLVAVPVYRGRWLMSQAHKASQAVLAFPNLLKAEWMIKNFPAGWSDARQHVTTFTLGCYYLRQFLVNTVTFHSF